MTEDDRLEEDYSREIFPCNPVPYLNRMVELITRNGTESIKTNTKVRGCLWVVMAQAYGGIATIDLAEEWSKLYAENGTRNQG